MPRGAGRHFLRRCMFRFLFRPLKLSVSPRKWAVRVDISHTSVPIGQRKERAA